MSAEMEEKGEMMYGDLPGAWAAVVAEPGKRWECKRSLQTFEDLEAWQVCRALRIDLTNLARQLPRDEKFRMSDQIIRAARSVTNNIAEGYGRFTFKDNIHFCRQARGSLYELIDHLIICRDEEYLTVEELQDRREACLRAIKLLNGYIRFLHRQSSSSQ